MQNYLLIITFLLYQQIESQTLLLKSSFNNIIVNKDVSWNHHLVGTDSVYGYTFPDDLPGNNSENYFNYVIGNDANYLNHANAEISSTTNAQENPTEALYIEFITDDPNHPAYSRVQYVIHGDETSSDPVQRLNQGYIKYKIKKHFNNDINGDDWNLPIEWKDTDDDGFRVGIYVYDSNIESSYWVAKGQYMIDGELGDDVWQYENYSIPVPKDEWFDIEVYWYGHPNALTGRLKVAINGEILFDITNQTKDPDQPTKMFYFMPFKVYGGVGYSWITDFEYWTSPPENSILSTTNNVNRSNKISIAPNPIINTINLSNEMSGSKYQIYSLDGSIIANGTIRGKVINISKLKSGVYFIKLIDKNLVKFVTTKIIKL